MKVLVMMIITLVRQLLEKEYLSPSSALNWILNEYLAVGTLKDVFNIASELNNFDTKMTTKTENDHNNTNY